ncbi:ATP-dependent 6-phosphofructokinase 3 isoform X1 [Brassica napus]|uniref:ATP-dependent 6-phosphofructokinase 3 isoform X1 n=1 Tax=Brassica napus TaxID=3708 RepID=UPI0020790D93|nr:ATP-dependent 6-phosphofructokinase 3 isoform X1 [Brassica napus]XP_048600209.1 ATP-dependent 6-phosphofructokinase 3 isoform X1 [Brassica napus]XP_048600210.1 ATP-dependent 6-phosphofructokinase 3 isoform X1 [Brassica napus]
MSTVESSKPKIITGSCGYVLEDVPHLSDYLPALPTYHNPLQDNPAYSVVKQYFVDADDTVPQKIVVHKDGPRGIHFRRAGPRQKVYFESDEVHACIVTCGGLCPGLNTVIREIVSSLSYMYGVKRILGIDVSFHLDTFTLLFVSFSLRLDHFFQGGYRGFYARNTVSLDSKVVNDIHKRGGTILGTSRGGHDTTKIVDSIQDRGINQVYIIGGDGTQRGASVIFEEVRRRGLKVAVVGIPKTIDNDIPVIDKSFGFDTAVEEAQRAINAAHVEAESIENGIGVVKLMGRFSGFIAMYATLASRDVDCCLIPESPFYLEGEGGLFEYIEKRLKESGHMVLVIAEGAGQDLMSKSMESMTLKDASGNKLLNDVGLWLSQSIKDHFNQKKMVMNLKYIDPTYMIRAVPSNASDNVYCTLLAQSAVHGAMAGYTGYVSGLVNGRQTYIPFYRITEKQNHVVITDRMWARLLSSTNQPSFLSPKDVSDDKEKLMSALLDDGNCNGPVDVPPVTKEITK